jgi:L-lactate dehydrogenase complex protein LldG
MSASSARSNILKKIKTALEQPTPLPFSGSQGNESLFQPLQEELMVEFAEQFTLLQGKFDYCQSEGELLMHLEKLCLQQQWTKLYCEEEKLRSILPSVQWHNDIKTCDVALTTSELLVARTGSIILSSSQNQRIPSVYAPVHICIAYASQLVYDIKDALEYLEQKYQNKMPSMITLATGPSRTADIEKTLVVGVHGPKEVYCFLVENE